MIPFSRGFDSRSSTCRTSNAPSLTETPDEVRRTATKVLARATIRRDLRELESENEVERSHDGRFPSRRSARSVSTAARKCGT
ncbi:DeoR family transcriptional regulator [Halomicrococcus sp. SG-WS-1]|uniref:DeoR family transcriptional regulator n=1 Tax=Halomicrococcus sp. SG-WS-1 TaxID=3439057 RepID=UPI003F78B88C